MAGLGIPEFRPMGMSPNLAGLLGARRVIGVGRISTVTEPPSRYSFRFKLPERVVDTSKWMTSDRRAYNSLGKRVNEHQEKLENFKQNPTIRLGMENQSPKAIQQQQQARIRHLEQEITEFQRQRDALIKKYE